MREAWAPAAANEASLRRGDRYVLFLVRGDSLWTGQYRSLGAQGVGLVTGELVRFNDGETLQMDELISQIQPPTSPTSPTRDHLQSRRATAPWTRLSSTIVGLLTSHGPTIVNRSCRDKRARDTEAMKEATPVSASPRLLKWFAVLAVVGLVVGLAVADWMPRGSTEARVAVDIAVVCVGPFLVYGFRFLYNAVVRRRGNDRTSCR